MPGEARTKPWLALLVLTGLACVPEDEPLPPYDPGQSGSGGLTKGGSGSTSTTTNGETATDTSDAAETDTSPGLGDPCTSGECDEGQLCLFGYCHALCDPDDPVCDFDEQCIPTSGTDACLGLCSLTNPLCPEGLGCNRVYDVDDQVWAACTLNPGRALADESCAYDSDCVEGLLCIPVTEALVPCVGDSCCATVCDSVNEPCFDGLCFELGIPDQPTSGYCKNL